MLQRMNEFLLRLKQRKLVQWVSADDKWQMAGVPLVDDLVDEVGR